MGFGGTCITVIHIGFLRLQYRPGLGIRFVSDGVGVFLTVCIVVYKFFGVAVDGICQLFFKVTADDNAVFLCLYNEAADITDLIAAG